MTEITIFPRQAERIAQEAVRAGAAVHVSQSGSNLALKTIFETLVIDLAGHDVHSPAQESLC